MMKELGTCLVTVRSYYALTPSSNPSLALRLHHGTVEAVPPYYKLLGKYQRKRGS